MKMVMKFEETAVVCKDAWHSISLSTPTGTRPEISYFIMISIESMLWRCIHD